MNGDIYCVVLKNGHLDCFDSIGEFNDVNPDVVECYLKGHFIKQVDAGRNIYDFYHFMIIDKFGKPATYTLGHFSLVNFTIDKGHLNYLGRQVLIHDNVSNIDYTYQSKKYYLYMFTQEIIPLMKLMNECRTEDEIYKLEGIFLPYDDLYNEYRSLQSRYEEILTALQRIIDKNK